MLMDYTVQPSSVSPHASQFLLPNRFSSYLANVCADFACFGRLKQGRWRFCQVNDSGTSKCIYHPVAYCSKWRGDYGKSQGLSMERRKCVWGGKMHNKINDCYSQNQEKRFIIIQYFFCFLCSTNEKCLSSSFSSFMLLSAGS